MDETDEMLTQSARTNYITCYHSEENKSYENTDITLHTYTYDQGDINDIYYYSFSTTAGTFEVNIENNSIQYGKNPSVINDVTKILGNDYENEDFSSGTSRTYIYDDRNYEYSFIFDEDDRKLKAISINVN